jgi:translation initiation factor IF-2
MQVKEDEKEDAKSDASFPCELTILPTCIFNTKDPIILGVEVKEGIAKVRFFSRRLVWLWCAGELVRGVSMGT